MRHNRVTALALAVGLGLALAMAMAPVAALGYGVEGNPGLRSAVAVGPTRIVLAFGPSFVAKAAGEKPAMFQVVSATDKDFQLGVPAVSVRVGQSKSDAQYPDGYAGPKFDATTVEVALPADKPMKDGHRYWVRVNSRFITAWYRRAVWITAKNSAGATTTVASVPPEPRYGLRELHILTPTMLHAITGPGIDLAALADRSTLAVVSPDDADFTAPVNPARVGRRSNLDFYIPDGWPWKFQQRHELFLAFDKPFKPGKTYTLRLNAKRGKPLTCGQAEGTLALDDARALNLAIKVNQCGYLPDAPAKFAYVGMWMGDLGACDLAAAQAYEVRDAATHQVVLSGKCPPARQAAYKLVDGKLEPDPAKVKGPETVYQVDLSYEDVISLDLSALTQAGTYYVCIPGMGRSLAFRVSADVYAEPFQALMNGLYHQRCGIELAEPFAQAYRPACHRNHTEYSSFRVGIDKDPFTNLPKLATDGQKHDLCGGHHDAGDWDPRSHLEVAETLFLLYELNPTAFADGQLNIPEKANGVPDVLDEALWALNLWAALQDEDGGVRDGIESAGDPREGDEAATDRLREFAFAKDAAGSYRFAAVAAQAALIFTGLGREKDAAVWLERARRAWKWADANGGDQENDNHACAAAMLLRATGADEFDAAFRKHTVFAKDPKAPVWQYEKHDQIYGSFYYCLAGRADAKLRADIVASFETSYRYWESAAGTTAYRHMREPFAPSSWGTGGLPIWLRIPAMAMRLSADEKLKASGRKWIALTDDFSLGCNPLNLVFTVGVGQRSVTSAFHYLQEDSPGGAIAGLQSEGPGGKFIAGAPGGKSMGDWPGMSLYPPGPWPDLYKYSEEASPGMNEGVTVNQVMTAFAYGLLLPPAR